MYALVLARTSQTRQSVKTSKKKKKENRFAKYGGNRIKLISHSLRQNICKLHTEQRMCTQHIQMALKTPQEEYKQFNLKMDKIFENTLNQSA